MGELRTSAEQEVYESVVEMVTRFMIIQAPKLRTIARFSDNFRKGASEEEEESYDEAVGDDVMATLYETGRIRLYDSVDDSGFEEGDFDWP